LNLDELNLDELSLDEWMIEDTMINDWLFSEPILKNFARQMRQPESLFNLSLVAINAAFKQEPDLEATCLAVKP
jgi:hypothetical protein